MTRVARIALIAAGNVMLLAGVLLGQAVLPKPSFEVVSIKPSPPNITMRGGGLRGDRIVLAGANLRMLLQQAYANPNANGAPGRIEVIGGPTWLDSDLYDVEAKADCSGGILSRATLQLMMRSMLEDRYKLKARLETRELPVYNLVVGSGGPKVQVSADQTTPGPIAAGPPLPCGPPSATPAPAPPPLPPPPPPGGAGARGLGFAPGQMPRGAMLMMMNVQGMTAQGASVSIGSLVGMLQQMVGRPVIDKTDLKGLFDFTLQFSREGLPGVPGGPGGPTPFGPAGPGGPPPGPGGAGFAGPPPTATTETLPSLFSAIQDLGLRLESARGPVEVVVIDSVEKPSEN